jgi:CubicO group peptidase (beta-lactamase class C family)
MKIRLCGVLMAFLLLPSVAYTQERQGVHLAEAIHLLETWLHAQRDYEQIPGLSAAVVHGQEVVWSGAFGYANLENGAPATTETVYSICSISKLFTGVAAMQLRDEGRFGLDDPLERHLPWFDLVQSHGAGGPVTARGILTHGSGIPRESLHPYWSDPDFPFPTSQEVREHLKDQQTLYAAWDAFQYSNLGLTLAGDLVEELSGQSFAEYVTRRILNPLGLSSTAPDLPVEWHGTRMATGYSPLGRTGRRQPVALFDTRGVAPAAGFSSNVLDLARFASWQFALLDGTEAGVLAPATLREMQRVQWADPDQDVMRGLAFGTWRANGNTFVGHGGYCPGYQSHLSLQPRSRVGVVFMANAMGLNSRKYADTIHRIVAAALKQDATDTAAAPLTADHRRFIGRYGSLWGEIAVVSWNGELHAVSLPSDDPVGDLTRLRHVRDTIFARVLSTGETGEEWRFEEGANGRIVQLWVHSNPSRRLEDGR